jgi:hypothetical protein
MLQEQNKNAEALGNLKSDHNVNARTLSNGHEKERQSAEWYAVRMKSKNEKQATPVSASEVGNSTPVSLCEGIIS